MGNMRAFMAEADCQGVAVCDVDGNHLENARNAVNHRYQNQDCAAYHDFRDLLARTDIDAVSIATPDHWHAIPAIAAAQSGKDIYGEKPIAHTFQESRAICEAVKRYGRIWQTGSWQRSQNHFRFACELVRSGRIGKVQTVHVGLPHGIRPLKDKSLLEIHPVPAELDYNFWLGPSPYLPYRPGRVHGNWRWHLDYGGGHLMDFIGHHNDIAHWGMGFDRTGPVEIEAASDHPPQMSAWNVPQTFSITATYAEGVTFIIDSTDDDFSGIRWDGPDGWVHVSRSYFNTHPKELMQERLGPGDVSLFRSPGHHRNFLDCVKRRCETLTPAETAHRSATPGYLGLIAILLDRKIRFDPVKEEILSDPTASGLLGCPMRSPWRL